MTRVASAIVLALLAGGSGCDSLFRTGESVVAAPAFPEAATISRAGTSASRDLTAGQARSLIAHVKASCPVWRSDFGGWNTFTRPSAPVRVFLESRGERVLSIGLAEGFVEHDAGRSSLTYCYWQPEAYDQAVRLIGLR